MGEPGKSRQARAAIASIVAIGGLCLFSVVPGLHGCAHATGSIGAVLAKRTDGRVFVREVPSDMTGGKAGLEVDDEILAIEGRPVAEMAPEEIRKGLRGDLGSFVTLSVSRAGLRRDVKVERGAFQTGSPGPTYKLPPRAPEPEDAGA